ncbi:MAG: hypothetical protein QOD00_3104 [Blastocatellia bacterium]|jgi:formylglycine-generating enzyme required for sulfatase activity/tRNA A-37 threonylcarbamoyl transferase component Bud32|nr:hypothetical protein [Blastocatellia bacterium]
MRLNLEGLEIDEYRIVSHLTDGSFTEVYLASAPFGEEVVVKALNPSLKKDNSISDEQVLWHFENEINVMSRVRHENVVRLLKSGASRNYEGREFKYLAVEYMRGGTLRDYCRHASLTLQQVIQLFDPVCQALGQLHRQAFIHCDIKPSNLLLDDTTHPTLIKLADFSVSKSMADGKARDGVLVGTSPYAAPEHHPNASEEEQRQPLDARADVYALAMTILHVLTGRRPDYDRRQIKNLPTHPAYEGFTREMERVLGRATALKVEGRYASIAAFWQEFKAVGTQAAEQDETITHVKSRVVVNLEATGRATERPAGSIELLEGVAIEMVKVPAGDFEMGTREDDIKWLVSLFPVYLQAQATVWFSWEWPIHRVRVNSFWMGKYPVTQKQWRIVATHLPTKFLTLPAEPARRPGLKTNRDEEHPVTNISWLEACEFCARLSSAQAVRLPTEAEWEWACRGETATLFNFMDRGSANTQIINYNGVNPEPPPLNHWRSDKGASAVGQVGIPNRFDLYDMHGNVWEWCADTWHDNYRGAPADGSAWESPSDPLRVARGGSWAVFSSLCRSASRARFLSQEYFDDVGFRIVI